MEEDSSIEELLSEIDVLQHHLQRYSHIVQYKSTLQLIAGVYTVYLMKMFYKNKGLSRPITDIRATDLLLVVYAAALIS